MLFLLFRRRRCSLPPGRPALAPAPGPAAKYGRWPVPGAHDSPFFPAAGSALRGRFFNVHVHFNSCMLATLEIMDNIRPYHCTTQIAATRRAAPGHAKARRAARPQAVHSHGAAQHHHLLQHHGAQHQGAQHQDERRDFIDAPADMSELEALRVRRDAQRPPCPTGAGAVPRPRLQRRRSHPTMAAAHAGAARACAPAACVEATCAHVTRVLVAERDARPARAWRAGVIMM